jgi:hypothetical protein
MQTRVLFVCRSCSQQYWTLVCPITSRTANSTLIIQAICVGVCMYPPIHVTMHLSFHVSISPSSHVTIQPFIHSSIHPFIHLSTFLPAHPPTHISIYVFMYVYMYMYVSIYLSTYLSIYLYIYIAYIIIFSHYAKLPYKVWSRRTAPSGMLRRVTYKNRRFGGT